MDEVWLAWILKEQGSLLLLFMQFTTAYTPQGAEASSFSKESYFSLRR